MSKFEFYNSSNYSCADCSLFPEMCLPDCQFADKTHVTPDEIIPDELIPWLKGNKSET